MDHSTFLPHALILGRRFLRGRVVRWVQRVPILWPYELVFFECPVEGSDHVCNWLLPQRCAWTRLWLRPEPWPDPSPNLRLIRSVAPITPSLTESRPGH